MALTGTELRKVIDGVMVSKPSDKALAAYRAALAELPDLWKMYGDLALQTRRITLSGAKAPAVLIESARAGIAAIIADLGYESAPMLERLIIDQILVCWLEHYMVHISYALIENPSIERANYWDRRVHLTQARYLRAMETLAKVRRLAARIPLQINIGGQQVNVAGQGEAVNVTPE